jgi:hypothetical protein
MEPLWSRVVATGGNQSQVESARKPHKQAETAAVGCDQLPRAAHGKEGVSGSSPEEGSAKGPANLAFSSRLHLHDVQRAVGVEPPMEPSGQRGTPNRDEAASKRTASGGNEVEAERQDQEREP